MAAIREFIKVIDHKVIIELPDKTDCRASLAVTSLRGAQRRGNP